VQGVREETVLVSLSTFFPYPPSRLSFPWASYLRSFPHPLSSQRKKKQEQDMASRLRLPALAFAGLSIVLSIAVIGCAARTLHLFNSQHSSNPWLLPIWPNHFDLRGLEALIGTSAGVVLLNLVVVVALFVPAVCPPTLSNGQRRRFSRGQVWLGGG
jgi:hypothetical protein